MRYEAALRIDENVSRDLRRRSGNTKFRFNYMVRDLRCRAKDVIFYLSRRLVRRIRHAGIHMETIKRFRGKLGG